MGDETPDDGAHMPLPPEEQTDNADTGAPWGNLSNSISSDIPSAPDQTGGATIASDTGPPTAGREWWRGDDVRDELRDDWQDHSAEAAVGAQELGYQLQHAASTISDAVTSTAYPAAAKRGLDIRWMRLPLNIPAVFIALLVTYGGRTATDRMATSVTENGVFAPLGWVLLAVLVGGSVMMLPVASPLAHAVGHLVQAVASGLLAAVRRGWQTPVIGYLMRLVVAVTVWAFVFAVVRLAGRGIIHWLTGA